MIELRNVVFRYEGASKNALNHVSLTIHDGEMLAVVGSNGSGKSTLAKHLNGLLLPREGSVLVNGMDTSDSDSLLAIRQHVGIVFQNPDNQLVTTIVEEDIAFGPENLGVPPKEICRRVQEALEKVGMESAAKESVTSLSGGQKQRIAIAGILAIHPQVLVLDESTAMLDPSGRKALLDIVKNLHRETGITVVMITQYMDEITECDRVLVMGGGSVQLSGTPEEIFANAEAVRSLGLDVPETVWLCEKLKENGVPVSGTPLTVEETIEALCQSFSKK